MVRAVMQASAGVLQTQGLGAHGTRATVGSPFLKKLSRPKRNVVLAAKLKHLEKSHESARNT